MEKVLRSQGEQENYHLLRSTGRASEPRLEHWYGHIGISAVIAALRFTTTKKQPDRSHHKDERR
jgi:hypothetical protein